MAKQTQKKANLPFLTTGWGGNTDLAKKHGSGRFLRLEDGETAIVSPIGEPVGRLVVWGGEGTVAYNPDKHKNIEPTSRHAVQFLNHETGGCQIFDCSPSVFKSIVAAVQKYGDAGICYELKREGTGKKTKYHFLFERNFTESDESMLSECSPIDLVEYYSLDEPMESQEL